MGCLANVWPLARKIRQMPHSCHDPTVRTFAVMPLKLTVVYADQGDFEPIRQELVARGITAMSIADASGALPRPTLNGSYRAARLIENPPRPKVRIECVSTEEQVRVILDTVLRHEGHGVFAFVVPVEQVVAPMLAANRRLVS